MNRIEISVLRPQAALQAFADTWQQAGAGEEIRHRLAFGSLRELFSAITEKRLDLLRHVASHEGLNVRQLAQSLGRDYKNVHTDVTELVELGLLERGNDGVLVAPYDEILIHAGLRDAA
ncbi:MarR family transcriptional regulator [Thioalkalicoccus limnaeus]|uniref:MarR family transcriptional regulator n=1 Tax=Thioalkalicoccus limnaeus TaxID=120681 RepID=A0ABV4BFZ9_9GAMM